MPRLSSKRKDEPKKRKIKIMKSPSINEQRIKENSSTNKNFNVRRKKRSVKSKDSESFKKKPPTDRPKSTPSEPREPSKRAKEWPEKEKSSSKPKDSASRPTSRRPDKSNSRRRLLPWLSRPEWNERTTCTRSRNRSRSNCRRERSRRTESRPSLITRTRSEARLLPTKI